MSSSAGLNPDDPWQLAKARFLDDLDFEERALFNHATLENLFYTTSNANRDDAETSRARSASRKLGPFLAAIDNYGKALDIFSSTASLYIAPIWGSIRVLLVLAKTHGKFFDRIVETLERIGDILPRFRDYERIYNGTKHQRLTQALSNAYLEIVVFCTQIRNALRQQKSSSVRRIFKPLSLDCEFGEAVNRFRQHKHNVEEEARTCHIIEASEERNTQLVLRVAERKARLLARLSKVDCMPRHRRLAESRHEGSGLWLTTCEAYRKLENESASAVLCCYGIPGSGKSVLASSLIDQLSPDHKTIFYYCDYADKRTLEPTNVFGTLARQLLIDVEPVPEAIAVKIEASYHDGECMLAYKQSLELFRELLQMSSAMIHIIFDGLDEATERSQDLIFTGFRETLEGSKSSIKLIVTGREELGGSFRVNTKVPFYEVPVSADAIELDIRSYVQASTRRRITNGSLVIRDPQLEEIIVQGLVQGAKGMFLWVEFQLQDLCEQESDDGIIKVIQNLPRSLSETYDRLIAKIEGMERRRYIERMFRWLVAARQPLRVQEILEGIAFTLNDESWEIEKIPTDFKRLVRACGNLVVIDLETEIVQLAHYTVQQYIVQDMDHHQNIGFRFSMKEAHASLGEVCVAYLNFTNFDTHITKYRETPYIDIATLGRAAERGEFISPSNPGRNFVDAWHGFRSGKSTPRHIDMTKFIPVRGSQTFNLKAFALLEYIQVNWLWHCRAFDEDEELDFEVQETRRDALFLNLILWKKHVFEFKPWSPFDKTRSNEMQLTPLLGWALTNNHGYLVYIAAKHTAPLSFTILNLSRDSFGYPVYSDLNTPSPGTLDIWRKTSDQSRFIEYISRGWLYSKLVYACRKGHLSALRRFLESDIIDWTEVIMDPALEHLLFQASAFGQLSVVKYLCSMFDPSGSFGALTKSQKSNALDQAIVGGHLSTALFLLEGGFQANVPFHGAPSLISLMFSAIANHNNNLLSLLLLFEKRLQDSMHPSYTPGGTAHHRAQAVLSAVRLGDVDILKTLDCYNYLGGFEPNHNNGVSVLAFATSLKNSSIVDSLFQCNIGLQHLNSIMHRFVSDESTTTFITPTPLYMACFNGDLVMARLLVAKGANMQLASPTRSITIRGSSTSLLLVPSIVPKEIQETDWPPRGFPLSDECWLPMLWWQYPITAAMVNRHFDVAQFLISEGALAPRMLLTMSNASSSMNLSAEADPILLKYLHLLSLESNIYIEPQVQFACLSVREMRAITKLAAYNWKTLRIKIPPLSHQGYSKRIYELGSDLRTLQFEQIRPFQIPLCCSSPKVQREGSLQTNELVYLDLKLLLKTESVSEVNDSLLQRSRDLIRKNIYLQESTFNNNDPGMLLSRALYVQEFQAHEFKFFGSIISKLLSDPHIKLLEAIPWCIEILESFSVDEKRQILKSVPANSTSSMHTYQKVLAVAITLNDKEYVEHIVSLQHSVEEYRQGSLLPFGDTPLMYAIRIGASGGIIEALATTLWDTYPGNVAGETALDVATYYCDFDTVVILCKRIYDIKYLEEPCSTAFRRCVAGGAMPRHMAEDNPDFLTYSAILREYVRYRAVDGLFELDGVSSSVIVGFLR